ncbi:hypothetical protein STENM327S_00893 [Streptomyces tendae]
MKTALTVMLIGFPLLLAVVAWVTWLVTRRALRPVEGIRREMAAITASEDLARHVPVPGTADVVARLATTTYESPAARSPRRSGHDSGSVADAPHELRSPSAWLAAGANGQVPPRGPGRRGASCPSPPPRPSRSRAEANGYAPDGPAGRARSR